MSWIEIIKLIVSAGAFSFILKWLCSKNFRDKIRKKNFSEAFEETNSYLEYLTLKKESEVQTQYATNKYLGTDKFHHSVITKIIKDSWNFKSNIDDLKFGFLFIHQKVKDHQATLFYWKSKKHVKNIEKLCNHTIILLFILYILFVLFEVFVSNLMNIELNNTIYFQIRLFFLSLFIIGISLASYMGSKASTAISLKEVFDIRDPSE